jgi:hypothetical protein
MWKTPRTWVTATLTLLLAGCVSGPLQENPILMRPQKPPGQEAPPLYVNLGPYQYGVVFEKVLDVVTDYFEVAYSNRYDGRIETFPRVAPGLGQPWKAGSPDLYQRLLASFQSIRHRAIVLIRAAEDGGFFIDVKVYRELEDVARPVRATAGSAVFRSDNTVERQFEVIDATTYESVWIPIGRDECLEQLILNQLHCELSRGIKPPPPPAAGPAVNPVPDVPATPAPGVVIPAR